MGKELRAEVINQGSHGLQGKAKYHKQEFQELVMPFSQRKMLPNVFYLNYKRCPLMSHDQLMSIISFLVLD
jgi:hypothetical protein